MTDKMTTVLSVIDFSLGDIATAVTVVGTVLLALLSTRFVTKSEFEKFVSEWKSDRRAENAAVEASLTTLREKISALETKSLLAAQPLEVITSALKRIEAQMGEFLAYHRELENRVAKLEAARMIADATRKNRIVADDETRPPMNR